MEEMEKEQEGFKPPEILAIEDAYGIRLYQVDRFDSLKGGVSSYILNENEKVTGLFITSTTISNANPIIKIDTLIKLSFYDVEFQNEVFTIKCIVIKELRFAECNVTNLDFLINFPNLKKIILTDCSVTEISPIKSLKDLEVISCVGLPINNVIDIGYLECLKDVVLVNCGIRKIIGLNHLRQLKLLFLVGNSLNDFSFLPNSPNLNEEISLNVSSNSISEVPYWLAKKYSWLKNSFFGDGWVFPDVREVILFDNPLQYPPPSVILLGPDTVKNYYEAAEQFGHQSLSEGRIIFIGDGSSGKSSIIEKVLYNSFSLGRTQTNGIKIEHWHLQHPEDKRPLAFHIWDFGGQEIQHAVHKFFFTEGCLYVLVLDNRKEEEPEYWLQQIESLGGKAPVLVVFNKQDENAAETADRKFLKEKYPNIVGFYNTSCKTGMGIDDFKKALQVQVVQLRTVDEEFPNNWLSIKKAIETNTSGEQHYLTYETYIEICKQNNLHEEAAQKLLLKYFNTIGAVTWFGDDTYLKFLHVLKPEWITQGVYKILTAQKTANLFGQINVSDFREMLQPVNAADYTYDEAHYGYILSMMKKFDLCYTPDDKQLLIPSAFGKMPKVEYIDYKGEGVRTYILQFKEYMPLALIHRFTAQKLPQALDSNYWYTGIVLKDSKSEALAMVHADKEAKRIYIRIKGGDALGVWGQVRRDLAAITNSYAKIPYEEQVVLDDNIENTVQYEDLVSHVKAKKSIFFHPRLRKDFNVGYLMGLFESSEGTLEKVSNGNIAIEGFKTAGEKIPPFVLNILNNNSPTVNANINTQVNIDIDLQLVHNEASTLKGDAAYLLEALGDSNKTLAEALQKAMQFADDAKAARNSGDVKEKGWGRRIKSVLETLGGAGEQLKKIQDGGETVKAIVHGIQELMKHIF